jgi:hypothetical protein
MCGAVPAIALHKPFSQNVIRLDVALPPAPLPLGAPALFQPPAFVDPTDSLDLDPSKV